MESQTVMPLDEIHIFPKNVIDLFLWDDQWRIKIKLFDLDDWTKILDFLQPAFRFGESLFWFGKFFFIYFSVEVCLIFLTCSFDGLILLYFEIYYWRGSNDFDPLLKIFIFEWKTINHVSFIGILCD